MRRILWTGKHFTKEVLVNKMILGYGLVSITPSTKMTLGTRTIVSSIESRLTRCTQPSARGNELAYTIRRRRIHEYLIGGLF